MMALPAAVFAFVIAPVAHAANAIVTVAGTGSASYSGDAAPAVNAALNVPRGMAQLADGSVLIADSGNNRIRRLWPDGTITTVAGTGTGGSLGDGGLATAAQLNSPRDVVLSPDKSTYYIADGAGNRIRAVAADGTISRIAGTGLANAAGDGGQAVNANLNGPSGLAVDGAGNLYIADTGNNKIRRIAASGGIVSGAGTITTAAGSGTICAPAAAACGDGGSATAANLNGPQGVMWAGGSDILIADTGDHAIRRVSGGVITRSVGLSSACSPLTALCGDGQMATLASLNSPAAINSDGSGGYLISDTGTHRVRQVGADGRINTIVGNGLACTAGYRCGDGAQAEMAQLNAPRGTLVAAGGAIYIADSTGNRIRVRALEPGGTGPAGPAGPAGPTGPSGPAGNDGPPGSAGGNGPTGPAGPAGPVGPAGTTGPPGSAGVDGADGASGLPGAPGLNGLPGRDGLAGARGPAGAPGAQGPRGDTATVLPLVVALPAARIALGRGNHVILKLFLTGGARVTVRVTRGAATVRMRTVSFSRLGRKSVDLWRLRRGSYRVVVIAQSGEQTSVDRAALVVR